MAARVRLRLVAFRRLGSGERVMERVRAVRQARGSDEATGRVHHPGEHVAQIWQRPRRRVAAAGAGAGVPHSHAVLRGGGLELSGQEGVRAPLDDDVPPSVTHRLCMIGCVSHLEFVYLT